MKNILDEANLKELRQTLIGYSEYPGYTDGFRYKCAACADQIAAFLDDKSSKAATAAAIEAIFGPLAMAEVTRAQQCADAEAAAMRAYQDDDVAAWVQAMVAWLPLMSEQQQRGMRELLHGEKTEAAPTGPTFIHPLPAFVQ